MSEHNPDNWVIFKILGETLPYRVLAGWSSSYLYGTSWRINSGIIRVEEDDEHYTFYGVSNSCYKCHKSAYGLRANNAHIWEKLQNQTYTVELMDVDNDWINMDWGTI